jgi:hypothetical protein
MTIDADLRALLGLIDDAVERDAEFRRPFVLYVVGGSAVVLRWASTATTKDLDVAVRGEDQQTARLARQFGRGTDANRRCGVYLDAVNSGLPPLAPGWQQRSIRLEGPWKAVELRVVDAHDLVISKLNRFSRKDRSDIELLVRVAAEIDPRRLRETLSDILTVDDETVDRMCLHLESVVDLMEGRR